MLAIQAEEGEGSGHPSEPQPPPSTAQPINEEPILNVVSSSHQKTQTPRQALNKVTKLPQTSEPIPNVPDETVYEEWDDRVERATTTATSLDAKQASGAKKPWEVPFLRLGLRGYLHRPVIHLSQEFTHLEVVKAVKRLEKTVKTSHSKRRAKIVVLDDEEDSFKQERMIEEINQDAGVTLDTHIQGEDQPEDQLGVLSATKVLADTSKTNVHTYTRRREISTGSGGISTTGASMPFSTTSGGISIAGASMPVSIAGMVQEVNISIPSPVVVKHK
ncbi:hypothetical protein Tco_1463564, partial [Tanacetum coccineum]